MVGDGILQQRGEEFGQVSKQPGKRGEFRNILQFDLPALCLGHVEIVFDIFQNGKYYRITNPKTDDYAVFEYVYDNKVIVGLMRLSTHAVNIQTNIKLVGLDENKIYTDKATKQTYYGSQLMNYGLKIMTNGKSNDFYAMMWEFE